MPSFHMHIEVRKAILWPKKNLRGLFRNRETGKLLTADEARSELMDHLAHGNECIPCGECDNFDYGAGGGCKGHP